MLQIRLSNKAATAESGGGAKLPSGETVTVACPDHLVLAELPVAKSLGSASGVTSVKTVGRRSRRQLGERVHFCVQCDFPIAIYGRLIPCEHAFCLDCARSDSICYLCDERIQKIQTIKMMEGLFICAAPHCLKSFLKKTDFEAHVYAIHSDLINPNTLKEANDSESRKPTTSESTVQAPTPRPLQDSEDRTHRLQPLQPPMVRPLMHPHPKPLPNPQPMDTRPHGFDGPGPYEYPMNPLPPPNFVVPVNPNMMGNASFGQPMYVGPPEAGPWNVGPNGVAFDPSMMMNQGGGGGMDHGRVGLFQGGLQGGSGNDGRGILAANPPPPPQFVQMAGGFFGGDMGQHGQSQAGYGWQQDKRDGFGNGNGNGNVNGQD